MTELTEMTGMADLNDMTPALPDTSGHIETPAGRETQKQLVDPSVFPDFKISGCFSSNMIIQRDKTIGIFGFSRHTGMKVTGTFSGSDETYAETEVGSDGRFRLEFPPRHWSKEPSVMIISSAFGSYIFSGILIGDVWLIGGQSNAECCLAHCISTTPDIEAEISENDNFRLFRQSQAKAFEFREDCAQPKYDIIDPTWRWKKPDRNASLEFSAMGYYFAKILTRLTDVPLGLIMACPGGACLRELMPEELSVARGYTVGANMPVGGYYNTLINPLMGLSFRGQLFFQGESEGGWKDMAYNYAEDLKALIDDERARFGCDFPLYNVQLSTYREEGKSYFPYLHIVRVRQFDAVSLIKNSHLAVAMDLGARPGDSDFAHSMYKSELGRRLAMQVYAYEYGGAEKLNDTAEYESPVPVGVTSEDGSFVVKFKNCGEGLKTVNGEAPAGFGIIFEGEEEPVQAETVITTTDTIKVLHPADAAIEIHGKPVAITYAQFHIADKEHANLVNSFGLPMPAWRISL